MEEEGAHVAAPGCTSAELRTLIAALKIEEIACLMKPPVTCSLALFAR